MKDMISEMTPKTHAISRKKNLTAPFATPSEQSTDGPTSTDIIYRLCNKETIWQEAITLKCEALN
jgi:hypothetical protein